MSLDKIIEDEEKKEEFVFEELDDSEEGVIEVGKDISVEEVMEEIESELGEDITQNGLTFNMAQRIHKKSGVPYNEIRHRVEIKIEELKGLISLEGALFVIGKELSVDLRSKGEIKKEKKNQELFNESLEVIEEIPSEVIELEVSEPPVPTPPKPKIKTEKAPKQKYPIKMINVKEKDENFALLELEEQQRILTQINKLKFAVNSALDRSDYFEGKPTRSGCHKIQTIFNISTEIMEEKYWRDEDEQLIAKYKVRAISDNGRYTEAVGFCEQNEKGKHRTFHDTMATAQTRATDRAILDLVGFGAVSAEEVNDEVVEEMR